MALRRDAADPANEIFASKQGPTAWVDTLLSDLLSAMQEVMMFCAKHPDIPANRLPSDLSAPLVEQGTCLKMGHDVHVHVLGFLCGEKQVALIHHVQHLIV